MKLVSLHLYLYLFLFLLLSSCRKDELCATCPPTGPDTTSHDFVWTIDTLGGAQSSALHDIAIVNDTLAYAVGEIYLTDSFGQVDPNAYNVAKWDGKKWNLLRVPTQAFGGSIGFYPVEAVFAFSPNNVWMFSVAGSYSHWNGSTWETEFVAERSGGGTKLWGTSSADLYLAGTNGSISYYNGSVWARIESGTTLDIKDIWGDGNEILAVASKPFVTYEKMVLKISGSIATALSDSGIDEPVGCLWFSSTHHYYAAGSGIYEKSDLAESQWKNGPLDITRYYVYGMRANGPNDVVAVGGFGEVLHYNGASWSSYHDYVGLAAGNYYAVAIKKNLVIAVGADPSYAYVLVGRRP